MRCPNCEQAVTNATFFGIEVCPDCADFLKKLEQKKWYNYLKEKLSEGEWDHVKKKLFPGSKNE